MIIVIRGYGRLGNRIFLFSHFLAHAKEYDTELMIHIMEDYGVYFPAFGQKSLLTGKVKLKGKFPHIWRKIFYKALEKCLPRSPWHTFLGSKNGINIDSKEFLEISRHKNVIAEKSVFRGYSSLVKHEKTIRGVFTPYSSYLELPKKLTREVKSKNNLCVGVHIRRGDYKVWKNGIHYHTDEIYAEFMHKFTNLYPEQKVSFLITSNGKVNLEKFKNLECRVAGGNLIEDLYTLAMCDFIIGPPSTYSRWASFWGEVPLGVIENENHQLSKEDFIKVIDRMARSARFLSEGTGKSYMSLVNLRDRELNKGE